MKHLRYWLCTALPAIVSGMPLLVAAQEEADAGEASYEIIWEVVVTARRREDSLQEVPLSVSAVTAEQIEKRGLRDLQDIAQETSGLVYENYATAGLSTAAVIRGMGQTFTTARIQNTAVFFDNIYLQRQSMINPGLMDLERVEVVKGPQNSQFGRNAFSGVVHYVSKKPTEEPAGKIVATYGSGGRLDLRGSLSGPLVEGKLYGRVAASLSEFDGHTDNDHPFADDGPGGSHDTNDRLGGWDDQFYSASLTWTPTDRWENRRCLPPHRIGARTASLLRPERRPLRLRQRGIRRAAHLRLHGALRGKLPRHQNLQPAGALPRARLPRLVRQAAQAAAGAGRRTAGGSRVRRRQGPNRG